MPLRNYSLVPAWVLGVAGIVSPAWATITFEEYATGTEITNQYQSEGIVFSGVGTDPPPAVYDYGQDSLTTTLHSWNWYAGMVMRFVEPADGVSYRPVARVELDNPVSVKVDYIVVRAYDVNDQEIYSYTSASPERIVIDMGVDSIAYIVLDDANETAYTIDNIDFFYSPVSVERTSVSFPVKRTTRT